MRIGSHHTQEAKAKISAAGLGRIASPETCARISAVQKGRPGKIPSPETREKLRASHLGKTHTLAARAKISAAKLGNTCALGHKHSLETRAQMSASQKGRTFSVESRLKMSAAQKRRAAPSLETRAKMSVAHKGQAVSIETRAKIGAANRARYHRCPKPTGSAHWSWRGGDRDYGGDFTEDLRRIVRWLYDDRCVLCDTLAGEMGPRELSVHHIDYNKKNNTIDNLVPLCASCHSQTNGQREYWTGRLRGIADRL